MSQGKIKGAKGARDAASVTNPACGAPWTLVKYQQDAAMLQELPARERAAVCHDCGRYFFIFLVYHELRSKYLFRKAGMDTLFFLETTTKYQHDYEQYYPEFRG